MVSASVVALRIFGPETGTQVFPFIQGAIALANLILTLLVMTIQRDLGYGGMMQLVGASSVFSLIFIVLLRDKRIPYTLGVKDANKLVMLEMEEHNN